MMRTETILVEQNFMINRNYITYKLNTNLTLVILGLQSEQMEEFTTQIPEGVYLMMVILLATMTVIFTMKMVLLLLTLIQQLLMSVQIHFSLYLKL